MKYAVIYHSETGNTKRVADAIYNALPDGDKTILPIEQADTAPAADVYFVGFSIRNNTCGIETMNFLDQIQGGKVALFATCGYFPADSYKDQLERRLSVWLPDHAEYLGMFLCQGKVDDVQAEKMIQNMPDVESQLKTMFQEGQSHPNDDDLSNAAQFAEQIVQSAAE